MTTTRQALMLLMLATGASAQAPMQRLPRQAPPSTGAIGGIVHSEQARLGVGGARVVLNRQNGGQRIEKLTTGDGVFLIRDVVPGTYSISVARPGFLPLESSIVVTAGNMAIIDLTMKLIPPTEPLSIGNPVRNPELQPRPTNPQIEEEQTTPYRRFPLTLSEEIMGAEQRPLDPLTSDAQIFSPVPNRWSAGYPNYTRYRTMRGDTPFVKGHWYDPYNRNKLKGDYPIIGNRTFLEVTLISDTNADGRKIPLPSGLGSARPNAADFYGKFGQFALSQNLSFSVALFHGDAAFRPIDWQIKFTPEINLNYLAVKETGITNIDPTKGTTRFDAHVGLQEGFVEVKLKDLTHQYDFVSVRAGIQSFNSDFRGFIFNDQEPGIRIFGNFHANRYQYNVAAFYMLEKDTNSGLNTFRSRHQNVFIANLYRQDFFFPGYTIQGSFHYNQDNGNDIFYNTDHFLVRPSPIGDVTPHSLRAYYYGLTGDGHIGRINVDHAFYQVLGTDKHNELAQKRVGINAQMAALELSLDKDWTRYRVSGFYSSGARDARKGTARGFDSIFDNSNFAGGIFSFWSREGVRLLSTGVGLVDSNSLIPSLRSSKIEGQSQFENPGLMLVNFGSDIDVSPKLRAFLNLNLIKFVHTDSLRLLEFQNPIHHGVGADSGLGFKYRPPLTDNIIVTAGFNAFFPFQGFKDILLSHTLFSVFTNVRFTF